MNFTDFQQVSSLFRGEFIVDPAVIFDRLLRVKAYVLDWDGVFNNGAKNDNGSSPYNEIDSMGLNMLRFNHFLRRAANPLVAVISGENNSSSFALAAREHFHSVYYKIGNKGEALAHLCDMHNIRPDEVAYFFDDVLDLPIAERCGLRMMVGRGCNPLLLNLVKENKLADYITHADGGNNALREAAELLMGLTGRYDETIMQRVHFSDKYREYLDARNTPNPVFYTSIDSKIVARPLQ